MNRFGVNLMCKLNVTETSLSCTPLSFVNCRNNILIQDVARIKLVTVLAQTLVQLSLWYTEAMKGVKMLENLYFSRMHFPCGYMSLWQRWDTLSLSQQFCFFSKSWICVPNLSSLHNVFPVRKLYLEKKSPPLDKFKQDVKIYKFLFIDIHLHIKLTLEL